MSHIIPIYFLFNPAYQKSFHSIDYNDSIEVWHSFIFGQMCFSQKYTSIQIKSGVIITIKSFTDRKNIILITNKLKK